MNTIKTLYKTKYGSHLYGTSTPASDVDYKSIVLPSLNTLLLNRRLSNKSHSSGGNCKNTAYDIDHEIINLQTFAKAFIDGQTYALELAFSVLSSAHTEKEIYDDRFVVFVTELVNMYLTNNIKALVGYAVNQANMYSLKGSRYESVLQLYEAVCTVSDELLLSQAPQELRDKLVEFELQHPRHFYTYDDETGTGYSILAKKLPYNNNLKQWKITISKLLEKYGSRAKESKNGVDWKATMHAVRIAMQCIALLTTGTIVYPFDADTTNYLLSIRNGKFDIVDISSSLATMLDDIYNAQETTQLPSYSVELQESFDTWLTNWLVKFYNISIDILL